MNSKLKCLLLDDELPSLQYLKLLCEQIPELDIQGIFDSPEQLLAEVPNLDFDLLISDIDMPGMNGIQLAELIKDKLIIFTTAHPEYAADAFDLQVLDYIRKPLKLERLKQAILKGIKLKPKPKIVQKNFVQINTDQGKYLLYFDQVNYIETSNTDSRDKYAHLKDGSSITLKNISFDKLLEILPDSNFCRINKKEIIHLEIVTSFFHDEIKSNLKDAQGQWKPFSLSEVYKTAFLQKITL